MGPENTIKPKPLLSVLRGALNKRVVQRARDTIIRNCKEDPVKPLVQRVVERDACDFCQRLRNSRPVLPEQVSEHFHQYCKCHFALFFQETRYKEKYASRKHLEELGITIEDAAEPDDYEIRNAIAIASLGKKVRILKRYKRGPRRADTMLDGVEVEFKNPTSNHKLTIVGQLRSVLYGTNRDIIKPQSDIALISNVRSSMTMRDMQEGLAFALSKNGLTAEERAVFKKIILFDEKTLRFLEYEM